MEEDYKERLENTIEFLRRLKEIEEEKNIILEVIQENKDICKDEILITFGQREEERIFGHFTKYYCLFCRKQFKKYDRFNIDKFQGSTLINLESLYNKSSKPNELLSLIQGKLKEYLSEFKEATKEDIENYLYSLDVNELEPKVKRIK